MINKTCKNHKLFSTSIKLFVQKPIEKSYWVFIEESRVSKAHKKIHHYSSTLYCAKKIYKLELSGMNLREGSDVYQTGSRFDQSFRRLQWPVVTLVRGPFDSLFFPAVLEHCQLFML